MLFFITTTYFFLFLLKIDYVYNPKEARIRKALRDRERSIVNSSTARSRRSNWSRQSPAPQMPPIAHDPHMVCLIIISFQIRFTHLVSVYLRLIIEMFVVRNHQFTTAQWFQIQF